MVLSQCSAAHARRHGLMSPSRAHSRTLPLLTLLLLAASMSAVSAACERGCSGHGVCGEYDVCRCFQGGGKGSGGEAAWTGPDCSLRTCPRGTSWLGDVVHANNVHSLAECSGRGECDRESGECLCFPGFEGIACERLACPNDCSGRGVCYTQKQLADAAGRVYRSPWDASKTAGCFCDFGYRGYDCSQTECPSGPDVLKGPGAAQGRECSGRGVCDYGSGRCACFEGFSGLRCQSQAIMY